MSEAPEESEVEEDLELTDEEAEPVKGGARPEPPPGGPVPIPYPNTAKR